MTTDVDRAVEVLVNGGLVAIPTETVYGLGAAVDHREAVQRIFTVKRRPRSHPLIVHLADAALLADWATQPSRAAIALADSCWPGPLTLLVERSALVPDEVTGGRTTVGLRVPAHALTSAVLERLGTGIAAPSANRFGRVSPTSARHVVDDLGNEVDLVLDGGPCPIGVESTIVDCTVTPPQLLRPGAIDHDTITRLLGAHVDAAHGTSRAPGMMSSHYAPNATVRLFDTADAAIRAAEASTARAVVVGHTDDLVDYARHLYEWLRRADADGVDVVCAVLPPAEGLGHAIRDRLLKASAARDGGDG